jgi:hypothetical protein
MQNGKILGIALLLLAFAAPVNPQNGPDTSALVTGEDVLQQLDSVIMDDSLFMHRGAAETLETLDEIIKLNQLQITLAKIRNLEKDGKKSFMSASDFNQPFYNLRASVCKRHPGMIVDLDGTLKSCGN